MERYFPEQPLSRKKWQALQAAARKGDAAAQWEVGYYHDDGATDADTGKALVRQNQRKALRWYTRSAEQGYVSAQQALDNLLSTGDDIDRDLEAAIYWTKQAIGQGEASAASNLGTIYRDLKKPAQAFRCYRHAVAMGDVDALLQAGLCYLFGVGVKQDTAAAYDCFRQLILEPPVRSSQADREHAQYWMAQCHLMGIGGAKRSVTEARRLLELANLDDDHEQANELLNLIGKTRYLIS